MKYCFYALAILAILLGFIVNLSEELHPKQTIVHVTEAEEPSGVWKSKREWKAHWVKEWIPKTMYVAVWKKVWTPADVRQWFPYPKPPPGWHPHPHPH